jgi:DNA-binding NarL/FixJ family response regulator
MLGQSWTLTGPSLPTSQEVAPSKGPGSHPTSTSYPQSISVAVLCAARLLRENLASTIQVAPGMRLWQPQIDLPPDVILCVAESGAALQVLRQRARKQTALPYPWRPAALLDAAGRLGAIGAGLHGFMGYVPPEAITDRLLMCLRRVAAAEPDAPRPHLVPLVRTLAAPPLDAEDREILRRLALGHSQREIKAALSMSERTHQRRITSLLRLLRARDSDHLGAVAVALGLGWPWELDEPADVGQQPDAEEDKESL